MEHIVIFSTNNNDFNLVIDKKIKILRLKGYLKYIEDHMSLYYDIKVIDVDYNVFKTLLELFNINYKYLKKTNFDLDDPELMKNENKEKLIINSSNKEFMITTNDLLEYDEAFNELPNDIYDKLKEALIINKYKEVEFFFDYKVNNKKIFITKDEVFNDLSSFISSELYDVHTVFERYDYFDINLIKEYFIKFYNDEIDEQVFMAFSYFMFCVLHYLPKTKEIKKRKIQDTLINIFDGLAFGVDGEKQIVCSDFATINYLYNEYYNIKIKDVLIYTTLNYFIGDDTDFYEVAIIDKKNKKYWMGFMENPIFDFEINYIDGNITEYINNDEYYDYDEYMEEDDDDFISFDTFYYIKNDIYERYSFDEKIKDVYFKKK